MKVLICEIFVSLTSKTVEKYFKKLGWETIHKSYYTPEDLDDDHRLDDMIKKDIKSIKPDLIFTINFWPPVSRACHSMRTKYISFSYDTPQEVPKKYVYDTNYIFLFDRVETEEYLTKGYERIYHAPLCTDVEHWDNISANTSYSYDVSLIGSIYKSLFYTIMTGLDDYYKGFLRAIVAAQQKIYGYYMINDLLKDHIKAINECIAKVRPDLNLSIPQVSWALGSYINYLDRISLLNLLQKTGEVHMFTRGLDDDDKKLLKGVNIHGGGVSYDKEMPVIFKESKINLNPTSRVIRSGIPQRVLDVLGCKSFVLSSYQQEILDYFIPDEDIVLYSSYEEAIDKAAFYIQNDDIREKIASNGYEKVKAFFSYETRLGQMLDIAGF